MHGHTATLRWQGIFFWLKLPMLIESNKKTRDSSKIKKSNNSEDIDFWTHVY